MNTIYQVSSGDVIGYGYTREEAKRMCLKKLNDLEHYEMTPIQYRNWLFHNRVAYQQFKDTIDKPIIKEIE